MSVVPCVEYQVGRGIADVTGEPAECGMLGYGKSFQQTEGIHTRLRARAFIIVRGDTRVLILVGDLPLIFDSVHRAVLKRLTAAYGALYTAQNVMITCTHTHCGPGGYSHHRLYNSTTHGFHHDTFAAIVDGMVEAVAHAHSDLGPAGLSVAHGELQDASSNRSPSSWRRNPEEERAFFPLAIDPQTTVLTVERDGGRLVGVINWFATHGTSMTNQNNLISGDNKGYAAYHWERVVEGADYLASKQPEFISAFAQTNAGDMSPNLNHRPGSGPTEDEFENTRIIGTRQYEAAAKLVNAGEELVGPVDSRIVYIDLANFTVSATFTGDGREHRTSSPHGGAAALAGTDEGKGYPGFSQGRNRGWDGLSKAIYRLSPRLRDAQAPKALALPGGVLNRFSPFIQERVPIQLIRVGQLYLIGIPGEVTITAGLRLRRAVAAVVGAEVQDVLVAGYSNGYLHYVTTPEEYDEQRYEGGSTLFGRWELPALVQTVVGLAVAMRDGTSVEMGLEPPDLSHRETDKGKRLPDIPLPGHAFGEILVAPLPSYAAGEQVRVEFVGANPNNDLRRGSTYVEVQRRAKGDWQRMADDNDWSTKLHWRRAGKTSSRITVTWDPASEAEGTYRIQYHGTARGVTGDLTAFTATTDPFEVGQRSHQ